MVTPTVSEKCRLKLLSAAATQNPLLGIKEWTGLLRTLSIMGAVKHSMTVVVNIDMIMTARW